jgi:predicted DNA-binding transcriptional regulator AlpA
MNNDAHSGGGRPLRETAIEAYSIPEFCEAHNISIAHFYVLRQKGLAPKEMRLGRRCLISRESAATWRAARTAA